MAINTKSLEQEARQQRGILGKRRETSTRGVTSLGIVQNFPTQFDEPLYRYLAEKAGLRVVAYYYAIGKGTAVIDPEIGRKVGWKTEHETGYTSVFCPDMTPLEFARGVLGGNHALVIISGYSDPHTFYTGLLAKLKGVPTGLRSDNVLPKNGGTLRHRSIKQILYPLLFRLYSTGHPVGDAAGEYLLRFGFRRESLFRIPYAVDHQWFARESTLARADLDKLRSFWGLPADSRVVCGVVKFSEREDPVTLIRGFLEARQQLPNLALLLIGDGPIRKSVEQEAGDELGKSIVLPGYQSYSMLPSAYAASDVFVHPARGSWEVSVNEALACGLPVVASDEVGSAYELILPNQVGYTYQHGNASDLAGRIVAVLHDEKMQRRAREGGLQFLDSWSYPATAERLIEAIPFARRKQYKRS